MIPGKSLALIRAACTFSAGAAAASASASLGHETRPLSSPTTVKKTENRILHRATSTEKCSATPSTTPDDWHNFDSSSPSSPRRTHHLPNDANVVDEDDGIDRNDESNCAVGEASSIVSSVKFWSQLFKNLNGIYRQEPEILTSELSTSTLTSPDDVVGTESMKKKSWLFPSTSDVDNKVSDKKYCFCEFAHNLQYPSPISLKSTMLNTVTASRHLFLVRHGQYYNTRKMERDRCLTHVGREQVRLTGDRLREIGTSYSRIVSSTMKRAQESAEIILKCIGKSDLPYTNDPLLEEGAPIVPEPPLPNWKPNQKQYQTDGKRIEAAFLEYFRRADISQSNDANEIIVCHANVIRYFVCRALEVPPQAWLRMWLNHGSITWLTIRPSGRVVLNAMGASGYMPPSRLTAT